MYIIMIKTFNFFLCRVHSFSVFRGSKSFYIFEKTFLNIFFLNPINISKKLYNTLHLYTLIFISIITYYLLIN